MNWLKVFLGKKEELIAKWQNYNSKKQMLQRNNTARTMATDVGLAHSPSFSFATRTEKTSTYSYVDVFIRMTYRCYHRKGVLSPCLSLSLLSYVSSIVFVFTSASWNIPTFGGNLNGTYSKLRSYIISLNIVNNLNLQLQ